MARTAYFSPAVYVEEVPSSQQPIPGVGTSTAAFIGLVPDEITYPVRNEHYNPRAAEINFRIDFFKKGIDPLAEDASKEDKEFLKLKLDEAKGQGATDATKHEELIKSEQKAKADFEAAKQAFEQDKSDPNKRKKEEKEVAWKAAKDLLADTKSNPASGTPVDVLKPYVLKKFRVTANPGQAKLCTNFTEYTNYFGTFSDDDPAYKGHRSLTHAVYGFFANGGTRCFVARIQSPDQLISTLQTIESIDEVALVAAPGIAEDKASWGELIRHCETMQDRFAILDCSEEMVEVEDKGKPVIGADGQTQVDFSRLTYDNKNSVLPNRSTYAALYLNRIEVIDPSQMLIDQDPARNVENKYRGLIYVAPSGHIAGVFARTDMERGVHKAPANSAILGAVNVKYYLSQKHQDGLNPQGVNCIRNINGRVAVWGARTIGGDQNLEWKYINVRRTMLYIRESIDEGTQWVVFEPNDIALWGKIKRNVTAFLTNVWRSGALFGATPEEAFYVKCDAELNPPEVRDLGQVVTEIGVAIVRPAEFVIFRISQSTGTKA